MQISDITKVLGQKTFERPIYAGNAIQTVESTDPKIVVTVRTASFAATGQGEPLRCCLRYAEPGEQITLISYAPFDHPSVWTEVGPVYIHAARCDGYKPTGRLPGQLATGPRVLRTYRADDTMDYGHNTVVTDDADLGPIIQRLLGELDVATVHVRTLAPQCFLYAVAARPL